MTDAITPDRVRALLEAAPRYERRCECEPCDRLRIAAPDIARAYLEQAEEISVLRAALHEALDAGGWERLGPEHDEVLRTLAGPR